MMTRAPALFLCLFSGLLLAPCSPARAAQLPNGVMVSTADGLEKQCVLAVVLSEVKNRTFTADEREAAQYCAGYFSALNDALMSLRDSGLSPFGICYPAAPLPPVLPIKAFLDFVHRHEEARGSYAMPVALAALAEAFPCDRVKPK